MANENYYLLKNDQNTVLALYKSSDGTGSAPREQYEYSSYGITNILDGAGIVKTFDNDLNPETPEIKTIKSDFSNPFGFQGMWRDEHTGLYHTHYRLYDPQHVRWLTPDPSGYRDGSNLYRFYAGPNGVDVLGLREANDLNIPGKTDKLKDSATEIENMINAVITKGRTVLGLKGKDLSRYVFEKLGHDRVGSGLNFKGGKADGSMLPGDIAKITEIGLLVEEELIKNSPDSIYQFKFEETRYGKLANYNWGLKYPAYLNNNTRNHTISATIKVKGVLIGTDKLEHIFQQGYWFKDFSLSDQIKASSYLEGKDISTWGSGVCSSCNGPCKREDHKIKAPGGPIYVKCNLDKIDTNAIWFKGLFNKYSSAGIDTFGVYGTGSTGVISNADIHANLKGAEMYKLLETDPNYMFRFKDLDVYNLNEENNPNEYNLDILKALLMEKK